MKQVFIDYGEQEFFKVNGADTNFDYNLCDFCIHVNGQHWRLLYLKPFVNNYEIMLRKLLYLIHYLI